MIASLVALRKESVDRNPFPLLGAFCVRASLSARRAWIEIRRFLASWSAVLVALRKESVDRNNVSTNYHIRVSKVALRKESVDRNPPTWTLTTHKILSLSARRAWIEILALPLSLPPVSVALRKESVDRNTYRRVLDTFLVVALRKESVDRNIWREVLELVQRQSLSARRAWIEMLNPHHPAKLVKRRSPQGERG